MIARFNQFNYVGGLLGAVLTGLVGAGSLRLGFAVPAVLILAMLPLARGSPRPGTGSRWARRPAHPSTMEVKPQSGQVPPVRS